ncbi:hypothetical protein BV133_2724 [Blastochloris viridis]|uniref:Uncharacterized protein n=1 Tax=Blastochloris viridis TaxID=1079 RepID=A0A182D5U4_BLAVI|nr:hypothetical protein BV133_2724 [Blastochloris viridis]
MRFPAFRLKIASRRKHGSLLKARRLRDTGPPRRRCTRGAVVCTPVRRMVANRHSQH